MAPRIDGERPGPGLAARVAARYGLKVEECRASADPAQSVAGAVLLDHGATRDDIMAALGGTAFHTIERDSAGGAEGDWQGVPVCDHGLYLSLTTRTAFGAQCAVLVCDALAARGVLTQERRSAVELCLHEAVANAVVHGNLEIASSAKDRPDGYRVFSQLVGERMRDPVLGNRRTDIFARWRGAVLVIAVSDQGNGFDTAILPPDAGGTARSGRGFIFMRALAQDVTVTDGGRCTALRFEL
ncbi:ATP-binding protein [Azospirillum sp. RWY-5-1]|uniref:ATP-binding protein n=1 Tax=Azospirillum oleiclasticum TaxID=2735135 RepID=A0ABX2TAV5_9PROT|nr:ATP-binding protein [Azospirillum oleiclasticum]NYZ15263.1 ATP-binding protein [Azospirillum oleiclasticum]NYZ21316.1 ATP-binding protein [Azospirillum oleiclasticum]